MMRSIQSEHNERALGWKLRMTEDQLRAMAYERDAALKAAEIWKREALKKDKCSEVKRKSDELEIMMKLLRKEFDDGVDEFQERITALEKYAS